MSELKLESGESGIKRKESQAQADRMKEICHCELAYTKNTLSCGRMSNIHSRKKRKIT